MAPSLFTFKLARHKIQRLLLAIVCGFVCGVLGLYVASQLEFGDGRFLLGVLSVLALLFGVFALWAYLQLRKEQFVAMYISGEGINELSTGNRIGTVLWKDVASIKIMKELGSGREGRKYIVLKVNNPNEYIHREPNRAKRRTLELKFQYYESPICFSERALDCTFEELKSAVYSKYGQYKLEQLNKPADNA